MLTKLFISNSSVEIKSRIEEYLLSQKIRLNAPDVLVVEVGTKLGLEQIRKIQDFLKFKPLSLKGRVVIIEDVQEMPEISQNAFLKTIEELESAAQILLGSANTNRLLPTFLSRIQVINQLGSAQPTKALSGIDIDQLLAMPLSKRFELVEKTSQKAEVLEALSLSVHQHLSQDLKLRGFGQDLLRAEAWASANGNIRGILEYLMIRLSRIG